MIVFSIADLISWGATYDPTIYLGPGWTGTAIDLLNVSAVPPQDRIWAVMRTNLLSDFNIRSFAIWCANQITQTDPNSIAAITLATTITNGTTVSTDQIRYAYNLAWQATIDAIGSSAICVATSAVHTLDSASNNAAMECSYWAIQSLTPESQSAMYASQINKAISLFTGPSEIIDSIGLAYTQILDNQIVFVSSVEAMVLPLDLILDGFLDVEGSIVEI